jgi:predicted RNase H-like nuclease (RuvC/YqgF family)
MVKEMKKWQEIDDAFKKIKTSTGVDDPQALVDKFEKKDTTYFKLLETVASNEAKIDKLKVENEDLRDKIQSMKIGSEKGSEEEKRIADLEEQKQKLDKEI